MMRQQNHRDMADLNQVSRQFRIRLPLLAALTVALCFCVSTANAQFSGPAVGVSDQANLTVKPTTDPEILYPPSRDILLQQGDLIAIHIYGMTDYDPSVRVSLDGSVQLPLIGRLHVEGLTLHQAEALITERLESAGMYRDPQVTVQLTEAPNQAVTITGEVHGVIPVQGRKRLFDVLSAAGGLPPTASHVITIDRPGIAQPIVIDLGTDPARGSQANIPVFPGDTVIVPRIGVVYLLGAFKTQGAIPLQQDAPLTLLQVAALGGGVGYQGKFGDLCIIRTEGLNRKVVQVDIKKIMNGKAPDPVLEADDIVLLPTSQMKAAIKGGGIATLVGIGSLLVLAATR